MKPFHSSSPAFARHFAVAAFSLLLFAIVFALFAPSIRYGFVDFDDPAYIVGNSLVHPGLTLSTLRGAFATNPADTGMYMPLLWISYMADVSFFGASIDNPAPFHAVNVSLHAANAVLFFFLLLRLVKLSLVAGIADSGWKGKSPVVTPVSPRPIPSLFPFRFSLFTFSFLLALLWAVHPLRVESVAWVTERKDTLSLFFALLSLLACLRACSLPADADSCPPSPVLPENPKSGMLFSFLSFLFFAAALLVKPTLVPLPLLLVAIDILLRRRPLSLRLFVSKTHFFLLSGGAALATLAGHSTHVLQLPLPVRLAHLPQTLAHYIHLFLLPRHLTLLDPRPAFAVLPALCDAILLAVLLFLAFRFRRRAPLAAFGILFFLLFLLPVSGLATIPNNVVADRFSYVPALGLSISILGFAFPLVAGKNPSRRFAAFSMGLAVACAFFSLLTLRTLPRWRSSEILYDRVRRFAPTNPFVALHDAKSAISSSGDYQTALDVARASWNVNPLSQQLVGTIASCIANLEGPRQAIDFLEPHLAIPGPHRALWAWRMAQLSLRLGRNGDALSYAAIATQNLPSQDTLRANVQRLVVAATSPDPADALPHYISQWMTHERADALEFFRRFIAAYPGRPDILANIAWILATADWSPAPPSEALGYASRALALAPDPPPPELLDTVAAAQANASDFPSAVATQEQAISLLPPDSPALPDYQSRLALYRQSLPYRHDIGIAW